MKVKLQTIPCPKVILAALFISCSASGISQQEVLTYPHTKQLPASTKPDKALKHSGAFRDKAILQDTLQIPFVDDFSRPASFPDPALWADRHVFINHGYGLDPPSIGVATFDCYNDSGQIYPHANATNFAADTLSSQPLNLAFQAEDSLILSFFYQAGGRGDSPEPRDSLTVEFYAPVDSLWNRIYTIQGMERSNFQMVMLPIRDTVYLQPGFRFRFVNYASLANTNLAGYLTNVDHWNLDFVYLNKNRSVKDSTIPDVAIVENFQSLIPGYESVPWTHYQQSGMDLVRSLNIVYHNKYPRSGNYYRYLRITEDGITKKFVPGGTINILPDQTISFPLSLGNFKFQSDQTNRAAFDITGFLVTDTDPSPIRTALRWNDTVTYTQVFDNYYAYDDGTAEAGYGVIGQGTENARIAQQFYTYQEDTLQGLRIHFNEVKDQDNINLYFYLGVWSNNNGEPGELIHRNKEDNKALFSSDINGFTYYEMDSSFSVNDTFYVGLIQTKVENLNIGFDANRIHNDKLYYNIRGDWRRSEFEGSLMLNPVMGLDPDKTTKASTSVSPLHLEKPRFSVYPNPATRHISFQMDDPVKRQVRYEAALFSITGRVMMKTQMQQGDRMNLAGLTEGIYFFSLSQQGVNLGTKKVVIIK